MIISCKPVMHLIATPDSRIVSVVEFSRKTDSADYLTFLTVQETM